MEQITYITANGLEKLKAELEHRVQVLRVDIADRLDKAIKMGDLKENADYHVAKEDQAFNEGRISQLSAQVLTAKLIEAPVNSDVALIGSTVTIVEQGEDDEEVYQIVGANEADPTKGKISNESPIGVALIGSRLNDVVTVKTPGGIIKFKVVKIS